MFTLPVEETGGREYNRCRKVAYMKEENLRASALVRVLIVDDHAVVRKGIRAMLSEAGGFEVVGEVGNGQEAVRAAEDTRPDVILMDLLMPVMDGVEATRRITASQPDVGVLVLTSFAADSNVFPAIKAGARGYLLKDSSPADLVHAIRRMSRGDSPIDPGVARRLLQEIAQPAEREPAGEALTSREMAVLRLIAEGLSNQAIADRMMVSESTARTHVSRILSKLHLASRTQAALYAVREGLTGPEAASTDGE
jgi:two-component system, NarL family, response regulator LiaR